MGAQDIKSLAGLFLLFGPSTRKSFF